LSLEGNEAMQHNGMKTELTVSIISPIALATAYFTMPQAVVPFKLGPKSFVITIVVIVSIIKLAFLILCSIPCGSWWWEKKIKTWLRIVHFNQPSRLPSGIENGNSVTARSGRIRAESTTQDLEMDNYPV